MRVPRERTAAILPVKRFSAAKQRLDGDISEGTRRALAEAMVTDVLIALRRAKLVDEVLVVSGEHAAVALAAGYDAAAVIDDPDDVGHSSAAVRGVTAAMERGATRVLLVPGDCPALDPEEVDGLLSRQGRAGVVIVPDRHGSGTNALLLTPPEAIEPSFGPGSFARHAARAHAAETVVRVAELRSLGLDVDTPEDLHALRGALTARPDAAPRTRALLERMLPAAAATG